MMLNEFSPGPWESSAHLDTYAQIEESNWAIRSSPTKNQAEYVIAVTIGDTSTLKKQEKANAHLMAAAPEMYEALKEIESELDSRYDGADDSKTKWMGRSLELAQNALAKVNL